MKNYSSFYQKIKERVLISEFIRKKINLTKKGKEYLGLCPFHREKSPSFSVNDAKRFYHCFGCGAHGDVIGFLSDLSSVKYQEAALQIAKEYSIIPPSDQELHKSLLYERYYKIMESVSKFFESNLSDNIQKYLYSRGIDQQMIQKFSIGYAPGYGSLVKFAQKKDINIEDLINLGLVSKKYDGYVQEFFIKRIIFPIKNKYGKIVAFGGRSLDSKFGSKYLNSPETLIFKKAETFYGENNAYRSMIAKKRLILVEGYTDVISFFKNGFEETVAILGTSFSKKHLQKIWPDIEELVICFDQDLAGIRASDRVIQETLIHLSPKQKVSFINLPDKSDPADYMNFSDKNGLSEFFDARISLSEMIWRLEYDKNGGVAISSPEELTKLQHILKQYSDKITDFLVRQNFQRFFSSKCWEVQKNMGRHKVLSDIHGDLRVVNIKKYDEIEFIEAAIIAFISMNIEILQDFEIEQSFEQMVFYDALVDDFKNWICEEIHLFEHNSKSLLEKIEKTGYNGIFIVLFNRVRVYLDDLGIIDCNCDLEQKKVDIVGVFRWFEKKRYLLLLKKEYQKLVLRNQDENFHIRCMNYLSEINRVFLEINSFNE